MRTSRSTPRVVARVGRSVYWLCAGFSIAVVAIGVTILVLALLRDERAAVLAGSAPNHLALLITEALLLAVAALSWLTGRAIRYVTSSRSGWIAGRRLPPARPYERGRRGSPSRTGTRAEIDDAPSEFSVARQTYGLGSLRSTL